MLQHASFRGRAWSSIVALVLSAASSWAQSDYTWSSSTTSSAWLVPANWTGGSPAGVFPGVTGSGTLPNQGNALDVAIFGNVASAIGTNGVGIDFSSTPGANGFLGIGTIQLTSGTGGNLRIGNSSTAAGAIVLNGTTVSSIADVVLANTSGSRNLSIENTPSGSGSQTMRLSIGTKPTSVLLVNNGGTITVNTQIYENTSNSGIAVQGGGMLILGTANLFTGPVAVTGASTVNVSQDANLGAAPTIVSPGRVVLDNGILNATATFTLNSLRGVAIGPTSGNGSGTINVASGQTLSYGGVLANNGGAGSLVKTGAGTLALTGTNTYSGPTTINGGTIAVGTGGSLASVSAVVVNNTGRLSGTGIVNGTVSVSSGGTLAPGAGGTGTLSVGGNTVINNGGRYSISLGAPGSSGRVNVSGTSTTFNFLNESVLELSPSSGFGAGGNYTLLSLPTGAGNNILLNGSATTNNQILGTFVQGTGSSGGVTIAASGFALSTGDTFTLRRSGDAVILTFQPVPEPMAILGFATGGLILGAVARRRTRREC